MASAPLSASSLRVVDLSQNSDTAFELRPDADDLTQIAADLGIIRLRKLSFRGVVRAVEQKDWQLQATLGATITQTCVVTLNPVNTRIDIPVFRRYISGLEISEDDESEMTGDETIEPLGTTIDPAQVMIETLALALPLYPRKDDADLEQTTFAAPGIAPLSDEEVRPFAGLAALRAATKNRD